MKKLYFGSNLKMYKGIQDTEKYLKKLEENTKNINREEMELFIIPPILRYRKLYPAVILR